MTWPFGAAFVPVYQALVLCFFLLLTVWILGGEDSGDTPPVLKDNKGEPHNDGD
jgi:hypothetical protein